MVATGCGRIGFAEPDRGDALTPDQPITTYRELVLSDHPAGYWRLGDSGASAQDETGGPPGTYVGTCTHAVAGAVAQDPDPATRFDGASCYVALADAFNFPGNSPFSVEAWVSLQSANWGHVFTRQMRTTSGNGPIDGFALLESPTGVYFERTVATGNVASIQQVLATGQFYYVVGVYDGNAVQLYVDGAPIGLPTSAAAVMPTFSIGALIGVGAPSLFAYVNGTIDEVAIYDHVLSPAEIAEHHDFGVNGPP